MSIFYVTLATATVTCAVESLSFRGTKHLTPGANPYYLNNNVDGSGVLVGQIGFGGRWIDRKGKELKSLATRTTPPLLPSGGAKCLVRLGDYYCTGTDGGTTLYAIDASDGTVHKMGTHAGEPRVYQVLRHGDELLVFGTSGKLSVYNLTSDTTVGSLKRRFDLKLDELYGAAIIDDCLFVTSKGGNLSAFRFAQ